MTFNRAHERVTCPKCKASTHVDEMIYWEGGWLCVTCVEDMRAVAARKEMTG